MCIRDRFYKFYPVDEQEYRETKREALLSRKEEEKIPKHTIQRNALFKELHDNGYTLQQIADIPKKYGENITLYGVEKAIKTLKEVK